MSIKLTPRQKEVLNLIQEIIHKTGIPPTRAELAQSLGFKSPNAAEDHIRALHKKGALLLSPGASRGIRLNPDFFENNTVLNQTTPITDKSIPSSEKSTTHHASVRHTLAKTVNKVSDFIKDTRLTLPVIGRVAAGYPIDAIEHQEQALQLDPALFSDQPDYLLKVKGESMKNIGILDGDLLAVKKTSHVRNGQIVIARIEDEVTVKRFQRSGKVIELLPENEDFQPIIVDGSQSFAIEGIAVGLIRSTALH
ncbi:transcriptional repressor LexA [Pelistega ratti]|uniref:transcriptional repressor LexA n=1 Tax=Pelistega ratti TaxID=2652177 RepID=UPI0013583C2B|nr:transcriptional repressor LexA [Pelistega ratti]